jgi:hypothetical protein
MKIGKLYQIKKYFWMLYPSKEIVAARGPGAACASEATPCPPPASVADFWSKQFNCNVTFVSPNDIFCLLEQDGEYIKVLSTNGELGWIILADWYKDDIEEVKV